MGRMLLSLAMSSREGLDMGGAGVFPATGVLGLLRMRRRVMLRLAEGLAGGVEEANRGELPGTFGTGSRRCWSAGPATRAALGAGGSLAEGGGATRVAFGTTSGALTGGRVAAACLALARPDLAAAMRVLVVEVVTPV